MGNSRVPCEPCFKCLFGFGYNRPTRRSLCTNADSLRIANETLHAHRGRLDCFRCPIDSVTTLRAVICDFVLIPTGRSCIDISRNLRINDKTAIRSTQESVSDGKSAPVIRLDRILRAELHIQPLMILEQAAMMGPVLCTTHIPIRRLKPNTTTAQKIKFLLIRRLTPLAFRRSIKMILPRYE